MKKLLRRLLKSRYPYDPLISIEISRSRIIQNFHEFRKIAPQNSVAPVLKSNAYGHGLLEVAAILEKECLHKGILLPFFAVDSYFEAIALRNDGIESPILIIGYTPSRTIAGANLKDVSFAVTSLDALKELCEGANPPRKATNIHIKMDTGMRRQGLLPEEIPHAFGLLGSNKKIILEGMFSHLSDADNAATEFTENQIAVWNEMVRKTRLEFPGMKYVHLSNTDGHRFSDKIEANVSRLGIGLYGLIDGRGFRPKLDLLPVLEMKTVLTGIKTLRKGETVGYSNTFRAERDMKIANIPVGYYEGVDRRLSNRGVVLVGRDRVPAPIAGRVSMNIVSVNVDNVPNAKLSDEVVVVSNNPFDPNSLENIARLCSTITYEGSVKIPAHLKRVVVP